VVASEGGAVCRDSAVKNEAGAKKGGARSWGVGSSQMKMGR